MRLLDTRTLTLHEFFGSEIPPYAILSHRWEIEEVTFQDLQAGRASQMKGYSKLKGCCRQAARDGFRYAWVDSCCIDKTSSSELSEAINSMYQWYEDAQVCFAFLSDVPTLSDRSLHHKLDSAFRQSKWFTRGWTLQELLAPKRVIFYDRDWIEIGTKTSLQNLVSIITRIHLQTVEDACVAQIMSWDSERVTTRIEDQAYCLMGLFGVNMPLLYGEGKNAFIRLQLEILKNSDDESLFAWEYYPLIEYDKPEFHTTRVYNSEGLPLMDGLLADSPAAFATSGDISQTYFERARPPFSMTNKGLRIEVLLDRKKSPP